MVGEFDPSLRQRERAIEDLGRFRKPAVTIVYQDQRQ
jgi:hypothetical protein